MTKNIVICLDGTGNEIEENISNVLKIYRVVERSDDQPVYYAQGVGTLAEVRLWARAQQWFFDSFLGKTFGYGMDAKVQDAYRFLIRHFDDGDRVFIFGYSRGAYTARVLAGMLHSVGILKPDQENLSGAAYAAYLSEPRGQTTTQVTDEDKDDVSEKESRASTFRRITQPRNCPVHFLGLFDTVGSIFVPNFGKKPHWFFTSDPYPHTFFNPSVRQVVHAVSIDERRQMFPASLWPQGQVFRPNRFSTSEPAPQLLDEMWFAGGHGDIGGGNPRPDSGLSQIPLIWMLEHAETASLDIFNRMKDYVTGVKPYTRKTEHLYPSADPTAKLHKSLKWLWWLSEFIPTTGPKVKATPKSKWWPHFPVGRRRKIPANANIHSSVTKRLESIQDYRPPNLSDRPD
ncbi:hypothetical protein GCM10007853_04320 [Algimonas ampicilliniresistens]|uniref:T6SS Phospholipase effector Tle1-like catalytic domain-containing protein n=1 Tax=Algimonas ampicilliniresistens TaxID=1298735 RepID=A0ABQ5V509_9PROT|nr:DUF2235 domain-containing protein [Algimonas ampicilliniresistens]GLQ22558.1 hypothetical protein GCM10007853_04320 [Algimonas ampicilliniresistens]